jgi:hypothetical protein
MAGKGAPPAHKSITGRCAGNTSRSSCQLLEARVAERDLQVEIAIPSTFAAKRNSWVSRCMALQAVIAVEIEVD